MKYINVSALMGTDWSFLEHQCNDGRLRWETHSGQPRNKIERIIKRPAISHYRAALEAVKSVRRSPDGVLVSHLPGITFVANELRKRFAPRKPHIAFAFNFTQLPTGWRHREYRRTFQSVDEFVIFSRFEVELYSSYFDIPERKFRFVRWDAGRPDHDAHTPTPFEEPYLCALGSEGRDYPTLVAAMRCLPELRLALIARPHSIAGIDMPKNVRIFTNIPQAMAWAIANRSSGMVIPLRTGHTPNGHVTLVGTQLLGIPLAITRSLGVMDYVDEDSAIMMEAGSIDSIRNALLTLQIGSEETREMAKRAKATAEAESSLRHWVNYFISVEDRLAAGTGTEL